MFGRKRTSFAGGLDGDFAPTTFVSFLSVEYRRDMEEIEIAGVVRDVRHLKPFVCVAAGKGKDGADLRVEISFSLHTISKGCEADVADLLDENGKPRQFCEDRYAFSLGLRELGARMIEQNYFCWTSPDRNRAMNYALVDVAPGRLLNLTPGEHHVVFFYLYPSQSPDADVKLIVTSCYPREMRIDPRDRRFNLLTVLRRCLYEQKRIP
jgi:hypothetical protein